MEKRTRNIMSRKVATTGDERGFSDTASLYAADGSRKYLNPNERRQALALMASLDDDKALFALTLAWTGARVSEVLALTARHFQIDAGLVSIATLKRRRHSVREVPLPAALILALDAHFHLRAAQSNTDAATRRLWPWHRVTAWRLIHCSCPDPGRLGPHSNVNHIWSFAMSSNTSAQINGRLPIKAGILVLIGATEMVEHIFSLADMILLTGALHLLDATLLIVEGRRHEVPAVIAID